MLKETTVTIYLRWCKNQVIRVRMRTTFAKEHREYNSYVGNPILCVRPAWLTHGSDIFSLLFFFFAFLFFAFLFFIIHSGRVTLNVRYLEA